MPKLKPSTERRRARRFPVNWDIAVSGHQEGTPFDEATKLENLSSGGAFFFLEKHRRPQPRLELRIKVPFKKNNWMKYQAEVVRLDVSGQATGVGVKFDTPRPIFEGS
jgi:hypothetical protein